MRLQAIDRPELAPLTMSARFKHDIAYFMTPAGERGAPPKLGAGEYWIDLDEARQWLDEGVLHVISPLDSEKQAELELNEEQESWLEWLIAHEVQHLRLTSD